jgi:SAM-dependent methyltransferase
MSDSYRQHFAEDGSGAAYDAGQYRPGSFWDVVWTLERPLLERIVREQRQRTAHIAYLDFACGTGRVVSFVEGLVDDATGIDISPVMLERAATRVRAARLLRADVTQPGMEVEGKYDLVTAFRFVLNAEPSLRRSGVRALAGRLRDGKSRLVLNTHGNPVSYKGLVVPVRRVFDARGAKENLLSVRALEPVLLEAGLEITQRFGMAVVPSPVWRILPRAAIPFERVMMRVPGVWRLGVNQILVCRLAGG